MPPTKQRHKVAWASTVMGDLEVPARGLFVLRMEPPSAAASRSVVSTLPGGEQHDSKAARVSCLATEQLGARVLSEHWVYRSGVDSSRSAILSKASFVPCDPGAALRSGLPGSGAEHDISTAPLPRGMMPWHESPPPRSSGHGEPGLLYITLRPLSCIDRSARDARTSDATLMLQMTTCDASSDASRGNDAMDGWQTLARMSWPPSGAAKCWSGSERVRYSSASVAVSV